MRLTQARKMSLNMTPMIDVVFQILIFFMVVTQFVEQAVEEVQLPTAQDAEKQEQVEPLIISIRLSKSPTPGAEIGSEAQVIINRQEYSVASKTHKNLPPLKDYLKNYVTALEKIGGEPKVQVRADKRVHYKFVQSVIYVISRSKIAKVSFATKGETEG